MIPALHILTVQGQFLQMGFSSSVLISYVKKCKRAVNCSAIFHSFIARGQINLSTQIRKSDKNLNCYLFVTF